MLIVKLTPNKINEYHQQDVKFIMKFVSKNVYYYKFITLEYVIQKIIVDLS